MEDTFSSYPLNYSVEYYTELLLQKKGSDNALKYQGCDTTKSKHKNVDSGRYGGSESHVGYANVIAFDFPTFFNFQNKAKKNIKLQQGLIELGPDMGMYGRKKSVKISFINTLHPNIATQRVCYTK